MHGFKQVRLQQKPPAPLRSNVSAPLSTKRGLFRLAVLVGVDRESARAGFVVDLYVEAERCAFNVGSSESAEHADVIRGELAAELNRHESTQENWQR